MSNTRKKIIIIAGYAPSLVNFRFDLLKAFVSCGLDVVACAPEYDAKVEAELKSIGVRFISYQMNRGSVNPLTNLGSIKSLYSIIKKEKPNITFSYTIKPVLYASIASYFASVPNIYSMVTGLGYSFVGEKGVKQRIVSLVASALYFFALKCNDKVFFQNPDDIALFLKKKLLSKGKEVLVNGSGVDTDHFAEKALPKQFCFLMIARLLREKGIYEYIEAAQCVKRSYPNVKFSLAGWVEDLPTSVTIEEVELWQDSGFVDFLGKQDDVRPAIEACSAYILPSYREGTPRTVLEAMSMGRAIITSDTAGCRETVEEGENGFLVEVKSIEGLVRAIVNLIENPRLLTSMGKASRKLAVQRYDVHKVNKKMLEEMGVYCEKTV